MSTRKTEIVGLIFFGISLTLSSCAAFQPVDIGLFVSNENADVPTEIIDPVYNQTIEGLNDDFRQEKDRNYGVYSSVSMDKINIEPEMNPQNIYK